MVDLMDFLVVMQLVLDQNVFQVNPIYYDEILGE